MTAVKTPGGLVELTRTMAEAVARTGGAGVLTGPAVLALRRFAAVPAAASFRSAHVLVPGGCAYGAHGTPTRRMPPAAPLYGLPTAPVGRAVADTVPLLADAECRALLTEAVRTRRVTRPALVRELRAGGHYARPVVRRTMRALLDGGRGWFPPEARLRRVTALPGPVVWDVELWVADDLLGVADAYWPLRGVAVEAAPQPGESRQRDALRALGLFTLRLDPGCAQALHTLNATLEGATYGTAAVREAVRVVWC
ncbi:hypothetical protein ACFQLX_18085 [Streptomyces polyrhachis]|uniref:Transcriptional regulator, AbiEi antitoxin, Type IV TA system n=1 Tax=Streptomyces polyrhachis TaxID=1282885 RepID=A0ABW2GH16_9ACTN